MQHERGSSFSSVMPRDAVDRRIENLSENRYRQIDRSIVQNPYKSSHVQAGRMDGLAKKEGPKYSLASQLDDFKAPFIGLQVSI